MLYSTSGNGFRRWDDFTPLTGQHVPSWTKLGMEFSSLFGNRYQGMYTLNPSTIYPGQGNHELQHLQPLPSQPPRRKYVRSGLGMYYLYAGDHTILPQSFPFSSRQHSCLIHSFIPPWHFLISISPRRSFGIPARFALELESGRAATYACRCADCPGTSKAVSRCVWGFLRTACKVARVGLAAVQNSYSATFLHTMYWMYYGMWEESSDLLEPAGAKLNGTECFRWTETETGIACGGGREGLITPYACTYVGIR